mmetsp:Transcript_7785/g.8921  ORF Transcript_7785/g.8921 Transcript_7785/m.8921 type:complete len:123 (-) Transcript_7785:88-456(-)
MAITIITSKGWMSPRITRVDAVKIDVLSKDMLKFFRSLKLPETRLRKLQIVLGENGILDRSPTSSFNFVEDVPKESKISGGTMPLGNESASRIGSSLHSGHISAPLPYEDAKSLIGTELRRT